MYLVDTKCLKCRRKNTESKEDFPNYFLQIVLDCSYTFVLECLGNNLEIISRIHTNPTQSLWLGTVSLCELVM